MIRIGLYIVGNIRFNSMNHVGLVLNDYFNRTNPLNSRDETKGPNKTLMKWQVGGLQKYDKWLQYPLKHAKGNPRHSNWPKEFSSGTKTVVYVHNGGHL